jgi:glycosyltransferase involved in cell wall biosynthesis
MPEQEHLDLQIIMPVHNEGESISATLQEWHDELSPRLGMQFIVCEDGSRDNTKEVLTRASKKLPMILDMVDGRRGYAGAVVAAFRQSTAPFVLAVDSDGQCAPADFWQFWERKDTFDIGIGWRIARQDFITRKVMSGSFKLLHKALFSHSIHDPSCPYLLIKRHALERLLPDLGLLTEGFWWEFVGRATNAGLHISEFPIQHRLRIAGSTVVFKMSKVPRIAMRNGLGLIKVWHRTRPR